MNLNHILLFLAIVSPLVILAQALRLGAPYHRLRVAALIVLAVTAAVWLLRPEASGYIGAGTWFFVLFLPAIGLQKMTQLAAHGHYQLAGKLGAALQILHPSAELREQVRLFRRLGSNSTRGPGFSSVGSHRNRSAHRNQLRTAPAVLVLILANVLVFLFELSIGDWNDPEVLHRIGALEPDAVVLQHEYWRLCSALFLHGGFLHLGFNLFALYVLGPPLERAIGTIRFAACYLLSGLASSTGVVALAMAGLIQLAQVIGASGSIMGIVGAWAGFLVRQHNAPLARQRLANIATIVVIQIAFDISTPEVSMAAHMCGLVAGFFLGLVLGTRPRSVVARPS